MKRGFYWRMAVYAGGAMTVVNAIGIFFARGVYGLAGFAVMALINLAWVLQALLENKPLKLANLFISILLMVYGVGTIGLRFVGFLQNMSIVGLCCACLDFLVGVVTLVLTLTRKDS
jgi:hypothetical protein